MGTRVECGRPVRPDAGDGLQDEGRRGTGSLASLWRQWRASRTGRLRGFSSNRSARLAPCCGHTSRLSAPGLPGPPRQCWGRPERLLAGRWHCTLRVLMGKQSGRLSTPQVCRVSGSRLLTGHPCQVTGAEGGGRSAGAGAGPRARTALPRGREQDPVAQRPATRGERVHSTARRPRRRSKDPHSGSSTHRAAGSRVGSPRSFGHRKHAVW